MRFSRWLLALGALCISVSGIWSMHFIGMAAMAIDAPVKYNLGWTIGSAFFAYGSTLVAFLLLDTQLGRQVEISDISLDAHLRAMKEAPHRTIAVSATMIALGVCAMHYTGMHALEAEDVEKRMNWGILVLSCFIALFAATAALYFAFVLPLTRRFTIPTALVAGVAVCGMHYTGMYAISYHWSNPMASTKTESSTSLDGVVLYIVFLSSLLSASSLAFSSFVYRQKLRSAALSAQNFAHNILMGKFDELETKKNSEETCIDAEEEADREKREDPMMKSIQESYYAMGSQLKLLKSFMPASFPIAGPI